MTDQRKKAGNIGDVVKHAILPELIHLFDKEQESGWDYWETHSGFYNYPLALLRNQRGEWSGERAWGVGLIKPSDYPNLSFYGKQLGSCLAAGVYPGSICLVDSMAPERVIIRGRDIGNEQVDSYQGKSERVTVS